jgi:hypothetical protein
MLLVVGEHVLGDLGPRCARMATGLAGGLGDTQQEMCGALSGGVLVIGGLLGRESLNEDGRPSTSPLGTESVFWRNWAPLSVPGCVR